MVMSAPPIEFRLHLAIAERRPDPYKDLRCASTHGNFPENPLLNLRKATFDHFERLYDDAGQHGQNAPVRHLFQRPLQQGLGSHLLHSWRKLTNNGIPNGKDVVDAFVFGRLPDGCLHNDDPGNWIEEHELTVRSPE